MTTEDAVTDFLQRGADAIEKGYRTSLIQVPEANVKSPWFAPWWNKYWRHVGAFVFIPISIFLSVALCGVPVRIAAGVAMGVVAFVSILWTVGAFRE